MTMKGVQMGKTVVYTAEELAKELGLTMKTIRLYIRTKKLKARKLGHKWYITESNLADFLEGKTNLWEAI